VRRMGCFLTDFQARSSSISAGFHGRRTCATRWRGRGQDRVSARSPDGRRLRGLRGIFGRRISATTFALARWLVYYGSHLALLALGLRSRWRTGGWMYSTGRGRPWSGGGYLLTACLPWRYECEHCVQSDGEDAYMKYKQWRRGVSFAACSPRCHRLSICAGGRCVLSRKPAATQAGQL
jgi:hypothetical protein